MEYKKGAEHQYFNEILQNFLETIRPYLQKEDVLICAISRKAPRLLDYFINTDSITESEIKATIISEISLPFVRWNNVKEVVLIDDAIYYGSTFNQVYSQIRSYSANVRIIPITCIKAYESYTLPFERDIKTTRVNRGKGHYFVNTLTDCFYKLVTPFEVEFPRITVELKDTDVAKFSRALENCLSKHYHNHYYKIDYRDDEFTDASSIEGYNDIKRYAVFFDDRREDNVIIEKIRFFVNNQKLVIMPLRSYILSEKDISSGLNKNNHLNKIWGRISREFNGNKQKEHLDSYNKVKCILINYVASLLLLKENQSAIEDVIDFQSMSVSRKDIALLFGADVAASIESEINDFVRTDELNEDGQIAVGRIKKNKVEEIVPEEALHTNLYRLLQSKYISRCESTNEALSTLFFFQNAILDKLNRTRYLLVNRLKYGLTLSGIRSIIKANYKKTKGISLDYETNKWIDSYIERGSIVPQYIKYQDEKDGTINWVRVFRSGENEVALISHLARFYLKIYSLLKERTNMVRFENKSFRNIIAVVTLRFKQVLPTGHFDANRAFNYSFDVKRDVCCYNLMLKGKKGELFDILDFLINLDIFSKRTFEGYEYVMMNDNIVDKDLFDSTTLPPLMDDEIAQAMNAIMQQLNYRMNIGNIIKMTNSCFDHQPVTEHNDVSFWNFAGLKNIFNGKSELIGDEEVLSDLKCYRAKLTYKMFDDVTDTQDTINMSKKMAVILVEYLISSIMQDQDRSEKLFSYFSRQKDSPHAQKLTAYFSETGKIGNTDDIRRFIENFSI